jgi:hypothetical protein
MGEGVSIYLYPVSQYGCTHPRGVIENYKIFSIIVAGILARPADGL